MAAKVILTVLGGLVILTAFKPQESDVKRYINIALSCAMSIALIALWFK